MHLKRLTILSYNYLKRVNLEVLAAGLQSIHSMDWRSDYELWLCEGLVKGTERAASNDCADGVWDRGKEHLHGQAVRKTLVYKASMCYTQVGKNHNNRIFLESKCPEMKVYFKCQIPYHRARCNFLTSVWCAPGSY